MEIVMADTEAGCTEMIAFRVKPEERERIERAAAARHRSKSNFVRTTMLEFLEFTEANTSGRAA
jgi:uncharacterized protein (DUF1778 family)